MRHVNHEVDRRRLDLVREQLQELRGGAFSPLLENPLVRSAMLVATSVIALEKDLVPHLLRWL